MRHEEVGRMIDNHTIATKIAARIVGSQLQAIAGAKKLLLDIAEPVGWPMEWPMWNTKRCFDLGGEG